MFAFVVLELVSSENQFIQRHWPGRMSPKWPIVCRVGYKTLTPYSVQMQHMVSKRWHKYRCDASS